MWDFLKKLNPFAQQTPTVTFEKMPVSFGEQALRNYDFIEQMKKERPGFKMELMGQQLFTAVDQLLNDHSINTKKPITIKFSPAAMRLNHVENYLSSQTQTLHQLFDFYKKTGQLPDNITATRDDFDVNKITIGPAAAPIPDLNPEIKERMALAIGNLVEESGMYNGKERSITAYFGQGSLFD